MNELATGRKEFLDDEGLYHSDDGPALIFTSGSYFYYYHGGLHRIDGPAVNWHHGKKEWFIHGTDITKYVVEWCNKKNTDPETIKSDDYPIMFFEMGLEIENKSVKFKKIG